MDNLVWFLIYAGLFFIMMRYGCGAHMAHGHAGHKGHDGQGHDHDNNMDALTVVAIDPVCGMHVDSDKGYSKMHEGTLYRFCSRDCLDKFESAPEQYIRSLAEGSGDLK